MGGSGAFTIEDDGNMTDTGDTGRFLSADNVDSANNPDRQEAHFEAGVVPRDPSTSTSVALGPYTDKGWSIAFLVNVCVTVAAALYFRTSAGHAVPHRRRLPGHAGFAGELASFLIVSIVMVLLAWGLAWGGVHSLARCPKRILQAAYLCFEALWILATIAFYKAGKVALACVSGFLCVFCLALFWQRQGRIRFGAASLKVAAVAVKSMPGTFRIALFVNAVQVVWSMLTATAAAGSMATFLTVVAPDGATYSAFQCWDHSNNTGESGQTAVVVSCECDGVNVSDSPCEYGNRRWVLAGFWLATGTWGLAVLRNVVAATVTGSVASWWFSPAEGGTAVRGAFYRATRGSFGSLCKAAAVITVVRVAMYPARKVVCLRPILKRMHTMANYGLSYAICFISIYGLSFSEALRRVTELFRQRGLSVLLNDMVVGIGLGLLVLVQTVLFFAGSLLVLVVFVDYSFSGAGFWTLLFICLVMIPVVLLFWINIEVVRSAHKAVVVCFMQDPDALLANHDSQIHDHLSEAWRQMRIDCPEMVSSDNTHAQIECTELASSDVPHAQKVDSPGTSRVSGGGGGGGGGGGAARGVVLV